MSRNMHVLLFIAQRSSVRDADLLFDQVNSRHPLCDRMFYLDSCVHLHKVEIVILLEQKFNRSCICIMCSFCRFHRCISHFLAKLRSKSDRR